MLFCHDVHIVVHGFCVVDMVIGMVWLRIKDDSSSNNSYSEIIWMMEDIVDKHSVTFRYIIMWDHGSLGENP